MRVFGPASWFMLALGLATLGVALRHALRPDRRATTWSVGFAAALFLSAIGLTLFGLVHSFGAISGVDPSEKATRLAQGISEAMNATAFGVVVLPLWAALFVVGEIRRARQRRRSAKAAPPQHSA